MTKVELQRLHKHYSNLAEGNFEESNFNFKLKGGEGGSSQMGEMSPERKQLIISDAKRHKEDIEEKYPDLFKTEEKQSDPQILDKISENKTSKKKGKK